MSLHVGDRFIPSSVASQEVRELYSLDKTSILTPYHCVLSRTLFPKQHLDTNIIKDKKWILPQNKPERTLDLPDLGRNFFNTTLDWSLRNLLAIALGKTSYIYNIRSKSIVHEEKFNDPIKTQAWDPEGIKLAIGNSKTVNVCDIEKNTIINQQIVDDPLHVVSSWQDTNLLTYSVNNILYKWDMRSNKCNKLRSLPSSVCRIRWSPDKRYLAVGGENVHAVYVLDRRAIQEDSVLLKYNHKDCVKALQWNPTQNSGMLATGGGSEDKRLQIFDIRKADQKPKWSVNTSAQVTDLVWLKDGRTLISSHGFVDGQDQDQRIKFWDARGLKQLGSIGDIDDRILMLAARPDNKMFCAASVDERLSFWPTPYIKGKTFAKISSSLFDSYTIR